MQQRIKLGMALAAGCWLGTAAAADWPGWRGPTQDGTSAEVSGWPSGWPPRKLWTTKVGYGCTSPVLAEGSLYVLGWSDGAGQPPRNNAQGTETLHAFDAVTGEMLWRQEAAGRYQGRFRAGTATCWRC